MISQEHFFKDEMMGTFFTRTRTWGHMVKDILACIILKKDRNKKNRKKTAREKHVDQIKRPKKKWKDKNVERIKISKS